LTPVLANPPSCTVSREEWLLDPEVAFLNHGSFGATPRAVLAEQERWRTLMERRPTHFMDRELPPALRAAAARLAAFVGARAEDLVFVENATAGCNAVLRSLSFAPSDEILVTDLLNYGMPLIRYRINDCAIPASAPCACGRGFPLIKKIAGRTTDNFYLANGNVVPGVALTNRVIQVCPGLKKVQVIQNTLSDFHIRYVPGPGFSASDLALLGSKLRVFFPDPLQWTFEEVPEIARERSGKTRFCISHVKRNETNPVPEETRA